jgi:hypothetical protein
MFMIRFPLPRQSAFFDGTRVLNKYSSGWIVDRFFVETLGLSYDQLVKAVTSRWVGIGPLSFEDMEHRIIQVILFFSHGR